MSSWVALFADKVLDDGVFYQDINDIKNGLEAVKEFPKRIPLGGSAGVNYINTSFVDVDGAIYAEIDGTNLGGLTFELHFMGVVTAADTLTVQLIRTDTLVAVVSTTTTITTLDLVKTPSFTLPASILKYKVQVKATTGGAGSPFLAYGFSLVQK